VVAARYTMRVRTRPWASTLKFYKDLEEQNEGFGPLCRLVEHIASQPYAALLFSTTSMHALLVAQHAEIEWGHDVLRVERDPNVGGMRFTYQEDAFVEPTTWHCAEENVTETFEGFLRRSRWVSGLSLRSDQPVKAQLAGAVYPKGG